MAGDFEPQALQPFHKGDGQAIVVLHLGDDHVFDEEASITEDIDESEHVILIANAKVGAHFMAFQVLGIDADEDFQLVAYLFQHGDLIVRGETGKHPAGVEIVEKLAPHF